MTDYRLKLHATQLSDQELLAELLRVAKKLDCSVLRQRDYNRHGQYSHKVFCRRFGSWNDAIERAGLIASVKRKISDIELFENLERVWKKLGRQPNYSEMRPPLSRYAVDTYSRRFKSWTKALEEFVKMKSGGVSYEPKKSAKQSRGPSNKRHISEKMRLRILKRDHYTCRLCGRSPATSRGLSLHIDHIMPFSRGGDSSEENLRVLCNFCNLGRGNDEGV